MIRILLFIAVILVAGFGLSWLADRPGEMILTWQGSRVETSLMVAIAALVAFVLAVMLVWSLLRAILNSPHAAKTYFDDRRRERGYQALSRGLIAAGAGDVSLTRRMTRRTRSLLDHRKEPLIHLLEAQSAMIEGRHDEARAKFELMAEEPATRELGLRGLYLEARRLGASEAAQHYAERANENAPHLPWAAQAALEFRTRDNKWSEAIALLEKQRSARIIGRSEADRKKAVLLTARAMDLLEANPRQASQDARAALHLAPDLIPAAVTAAKALYRMGDLRKGSKILEKAWKANPHPEIAETYVRARTGDSVQDRLRRARKLDALKPNHIESMLVVARAALAAHDYKLARERAEAAARLQPREGIFLLLADIEEAETGDQGRVRHWLSQAVRAPRDAAWTADGYVSDRWAAVSPVNGKLDQFVWKVPVEQIRGPVEDGSILPLDADDAIKSLPPVRSSVTNPEAADDRPSAKPEASMTGSASKPQTAADIEPRPDTKNAAKTDPAPVQAAVRPAPLPETTVAAAPIATAPKVEPAPAPAADQTAKTAAQELSAAPAPSTTPSTLPATPPAKGDTHAANDVQKPALSVVADNSRKADQPSAAAAAMVNRDAPPKAVEAAPADAPGRSTHAAGTAELSDSKDDEAELEKRFLSQRIDDPGVNPDRVPAKPAAVSRFKLF
jgi:HemY protein